MNKRGGGRKIKRFPPAGTASGKAKEPKSSKRPAAPEKTPMQRRIKEKNEGLGVLKGVAVIILLLIVGSAILFNRAGGREAERGDKTPGELCEKTVECARGSLCYAYKDNRSRCHETCSKDRPCDPGHTCVTAASQKRRRGVRLADICVADAEK